VVAASVIAMGLISLPIMLRYGYDRRSPSGVIAASGTLAQIIPPSLVLIVMADQLGRSVGDMYKGAIIPGFYSIEVVSMVPPLVLMFLVLGSIFIGWATPTEGGAMGAVGALLLAFSKGKLNRKMLVESMHSTAKIASFVIFILIGASVYSVWCFAASMAICGWSTCCSICPAVNWAF
jgi:TRAP-type mannitol/chloroaromatic compound transport system permease large subunit